MDNLATQNDVQRNCLEIRNSIPNNDAVRVLQEVDLSTPLSTTQPQYITGRKSTTPGSVSRQLASTAMFGGANHLNACGTPSSTSQSQSERNSSEKTASDFDATAIRPRGAPDTDSAVDYETNGPLGAHNKLVLEPRARDKQGGKQRLFDVPLNDDASSDDEYPIQKGGVKRSGKRNRCRNGAAGEKNDPGRYRAQNDAVAPDGDGKAVTLPALEDGLSSASPVDSNDDEFDTDERTANGGFGRHRVRTKKRSSMKKRSAQVPAPPTDTLLNLNLVQEINDEIDSLKRTFLYETAQAAQQTTETDVAKCDAALASIPSIPPPPSALVCLERRDNERAANGTGKLIDADTPTRMPTERIDTLIASETEADTDTSPATVTLTAFSKNGKLLPCTLLLSHAFLCSRCHR